MIHKVEEQSYLSEKGLKSSFYRSLEPPSFELEKIVYRWITAILDPN